MQTVIVAITAIGLLVAGFLFGSSGKVDCRTAGFSPDTTTREKELCRNEKTLIIVPTRQPSKPKE